MLLDHNLSSNSLASESHNYSDAVPPMPKAKGVTQSERLCDEGQTKLNEPSQTSSLGLLKGVLKNYALLKGYTTQVVLGFIKVCPGRP